MKNENGKKAASVKLKLKLDIISGIMGPNIFVINDITKKVKKIKPTIK